MPPGFPKDYQGFSVATGPDGSIFTFSGYGYPTDVERAHAFQKYTTFDTAYSYRNGVIEIVGKNEPPNPVMDISFIEQNGWVGWNRFATAGGKKWIAHHRTQDCTNSSFSTLHEQYSHHVGQGIV